MLVLSILAVIIAISLIVYKAPVDPASLQFGQRTDPEALNKLRQQYFLDRPYYIQVLKYLEDISPVQIAHSNDNRLKEYQYATLFQLKHQRLILKWPYLRKSYVSGESVSNLIREAFPSTLLLGAAALVFAFVVGMILGILAALFRNTGIDQSILSVSTLFYSVPSYISAIIFALIFGYYLRDYTGLPIQGSVFGLDDFGNEITDWSKLILPSIALGIRPIAMICQMTRASLIEALNEPYILTARAYGIKKF
ncbi:MAG: ABC transporter permease [Saprospiraceae bacterium]|nr:ABC transporter permease [Saprospiraceae bacterium]